MYILCLSYLTTTVPWILGSTLSTSLSTFERLSARANLAENLQTQTKSGFETTKRYSATGTAEGLKIWRGKGQLISICLFVSSNLPKKQRNFFQDFCPSLWKEVKSKKITALYTTNWKILFDYLTLPFWFDLFLEATTICSILKSHNFKSCISGTIYKKCHATFLFM